MPRSNAKGRRHARRKYNSGLESKVAKQLQSAGVPFEFESEKIDYLVPAQWRKYTPDFPIMTRSGKKIYIETKGIWDADDRKKHLLIREQRPDLDIRFVFTNSKSKISKNSKTTYADICEGRGRKPFKGITWHYADKKIPSEWWNE